MSSHRDRRQTESVIIRLTEYRTAQITAATSGEINVCQVTIPDQSIVIDSTASNA